MHFTWYENLEKVRQYILINQERPSKRSQDSETRRLGIWIKNQLRNYNVYRRKMKYNDIRNLWENFINEFSYYFKSEQDIWNENLNNVILYIERYQKRPSSKDKDNIIRKLAIWLDHQKRNYDTNQGLINTNEQIRASWECFIEQYSSYLKFQREMWLKNLEELKKYLINHHKRPSDKSKDIETRYLGHWLHNQITSFNGKQRIMKNERIRNIWEKFKEKYIDHLDIVDSLVNLHEKHSRKRKLSNINDD